MVTVVEANEVDSSGPPTLKLRLTEKKGSGETKPKPEKKGVKWTSETGMIAREVENLNVPQQTW